MNLKPLALGLLGFLALPACAADTTAESGSPPHENVQSTKQAIEDGSLALGWQIERAVRIAGPGGGCSGVKIGARHVITALHCGVSPGDTVTFYTSNTPYPEATDVTRTVEAVGKRPGTYWGVGAPSGDWTDSDGLYADIAILRLDGPVRGTETARMSWLYPGDDALGEKVGNGGHEDNPNLFGVLMHKADETWTSSDVDGIFRTSESAVNGGDSGGAFYHQTRLLGVLSGHDNTSIIERARYTSVARHLHWILDVINWEWTGLIPPLNGRVLQGAPLASFAGKSHVVCQYACMNTTGCAGYNYSGAADYCFLLSSVTSNTNGNTGWASAIR